MSLFDKFTGNKTRKEDLPEEKAKLVDPKFGIISFFKLSFHRIGNLTKINLIIMLMMSPIAFTLFGFSGSLFGWQISDLAFTPSSSVFAHYQGIAAYENSTVLDSLLTPFSFLTTVVIDNAATTILKYMGLIVILLFGPMNVGCTYVLRNIVREEHVFIWYDFFSSIKKNLKQSIIYGIIDCVCIAAISYALPFYYTYANSFSMQMLLCAMVIITVLYFIMRIFIYLMIVTFDLSFRKLFKYAFILTTAGFKRIFMMLLGLFTLFIISAYLFILLRGIGLLLICVFTIAFAYLICVYCAYPVIKRHMIDPFYDEDGNPKDQPKTKSQDVASANT